ARPPTHLRVPAPRGGCRSARGHGTSGSLRHRGHDEHLFARHPGAAGRVRAADGRALPVASAWRPLHHMRPTVNSKAETSKMRSHPTDANILGSPSRTDGPWPEFPYPTFWVDRFPSTSSANPQFMAVV